MKKLLSLIMTMILVGALLVGCSQTVTDDNYDPTGVEPGEGKDSASFEISEEDQDGATDEGQGDDIEAEAAVEVRAEPLEVKVIAPYGTPTLSMVKMMTENPSLGDNVTVTYEALEATDVLSAELINHNADFAIIPTNLAAVLRSKGAEYKIAGSSVWGVLYIVSTEDIQSIEDLKGKEIAMIGRNLTPDAMFRYILTENGIDPETDVTLNYYAGSTELAGAFIGGQDTVALIPQPLLTNVLMKKEDAKVVLDLQEAFGDLTGDNRYPLSSLVVSERLMAAHPEVVDAFLAEFEASVNWLNDNPAEAGAYYESLEIGLNASIIEKAIPGCNLTYVSAAEHKDLFDKYLDVLYQFNPAILGGQPVDEALYIEK